MRKFKPFQQIIRNVSTNIIRDQVECFGQFIKINDTLWNINNINDIRLSDDKCSIYINTINNENNDFIYMTEQVDADKLFNDICEKIKHAKRLYSYQ